MSLTSHPGVDNHTGIVTLKNKKIIEFHIEEERKEREKERIGSLERTKLPWKYFGWRL